MNWYKFAKDETYKQLVAKIKDVLRIHPLPLMLMDQYHIPIEDIDDHLDIEVADLDGRYAEGNGDRIRVDRSVLNKPNFVEEHFHYIMHEFFHWVKRRNEDLFYFNDEEEVQGFTLNIAWELLSGKTIDDIGRTIYPIIDGHFDREDEAREMYSKMLQEAQDIVNIVRRNNA